MLSQNVPVLSRASLPVTLFICQSLNARTDKTSPDDFGGLHP